MRRIGNHDDPHLSIKPKLDVRDLQVCVALATAGSTVRAASALHITQSAVSRGLLLAEEKLGARIFERTTKGLVPTAAGGRLLEGARVLLAQLVELEGRVTSDAEAAAPLRVVCQCYTAYRWLPSTVAKLNLDVELSIDHTLEPVAALLDDEIDVALLTTGVLPPRAKARFEERPLFADEIIFLVSEGHPLARKTLTVNDLFEHRLINSTQTPDREREWFFQHVFETKRPQFKIRPMRFPLTEAIIDAARAGMGIAILSDWTASPYLREQSGLVVKRLNGKPISRPWSIAYRRDRKDDALRLAAAIEHAPPKIYLVDEKKPRRRVSA